MRVQRLCSEAILLSFKGAGAPPSPAIALTRRTPTDCLVSNIEKAAVEITLTREGRSAMHFFGRLLNTAAQFLAVKLPPWADASLQSAIVGGKPARPVEGDRPDVVLVPVPKTGDDGPLKDGVAFHLVFRANAPAPLSKKGVLSVPLPTLSVPVTELKLRCVLPPRASGKLDETHSHGFVATSSSPVVGLLLELEKETAPVTPPPAPALRPVGRGAGGFAPMQERAAALALASNMRQMQQCEEQFMEDEDSSSAESVEYVSRARPMVIGTSMKMKKPTKMAPVHVKRVQISSDSLSLFAAKMFSDADEDLAVTFRYKF
eukprot:gnl/Ergobibamus_cyprinoides/395.p1 GENE.gnl/Ergobibamus_cyprinoides/395~~gnl/Ergobibamus_cyprinoides/395.p1  ORF type:complete len:318 (+),score=68.23 gnl/Ergobibamus_cyprinoides/395:712-1665(+)